MASSKPAFTLGIEEEYLLVDPETRASRAASRRASCERCEEALGAQVTHEFLQSQVEVGTSVCRSVERGARRNWRSSGAPSATCAREFGLRMIAASTHPWASWHQQAPVEIERYRILTEAHQSLARRMVICGMHVHAGIEDPRTAHRADEPGDLFPAPPAGAQHLLAVLGGARHRHQGVPADRSSATCRAPACRSSSTASPTGARCCELLARTPASATIPPRSGGTFARAPSTRRSRCASATCARESTTPSPSPPSTSRSWRSSITCAPTTSPGGSYRRILVAENKWRAQRYGLQGSLADFGRRKLVPLPELIDELIGSAARAGARSSAAWPQLEQAREIVRDGTSADHQLRVYNAALEAGADEHEAQVKVVDWLIEASLEGVSAEPTAR